MSRRLEIVGLLFGAGFGFVLAAARLHEYDTIHRMLRLDEIDVFLLMGAAIGTSLPVLWWLERKVANTRLGGPLKLSRSRPNRQNVIGGALFGLGWAFAGTCPAPALVMVSSGAVLGVVVTAGLFIGIHLRDRQIAGAPSGDGEHRIMVGAGAGEGRV